VIYERVTMSTNTINIILVAGAIATLLLLYFGFVDHWSHIKKVADWVRQQVLRLKPDPTPVELNLPPAPPPTELPADGVTKKPVMYIMFGPNRLLAYETTRQGFPGTRFLVERHLPNEQPKYCDTPNRDEANAQWRKWYEEWKAKPGGFGGASGTGLNGKPPW
jgi:hypothetical protein